MAENKVVFGIKNVHFGTYTVGTTGTVTLGSPFALPGTVNMTLEPESEETVFYADDTKYYTSYNDNGYTGELENANFTDAFKLAFMNYITLDDGGIAQIKGVKNKTVYMMFESEGDVESRRGIIYNVELGQINREYATTEESAEPQTATLSFTVNGDNGTGITKVSYGKEATGYSTLFTNPPVPALPTPTT